MNQFFSTAILVMGYNRHESLRKVLEALNKIKIDSNVDLIISIDGGGTTSVNKLVNEYNWSYGQKKVIIHSTRLGLKNHFIWAGDQTEFYDSILFLEDDIMPAPYALDVVKQMVSKYSSDDCIAAGSLYSPLLCEFVGSKFYKIHDGQDVFFLAHPYWGTIWMKNGWKLFKKWYETYEYNENLLPTAVSQWKNNSSFKKIFIQYLAETQRTCVFPRVSYVTNLGVAGENAPMSTNCYQTVLSSYKPNLRMPEYALSESSYDVFMEILPKILKKKFSELESYDFSVDLKQTRTFFSTPYLLTTRPVKKAIITFSGRMKPFENAIFFNMKGEGISLARTEDVIISDERDLIAAKDIRANYPLEPKTILYLMKMGFVKYINRRYASFKKRRKK